MKRLLSVPGVCAKCPTLIQMFFTTKVNLNMAALSKNFNHKKYEKKTKLNFREYTH